MSQAVKSGRGDSYMELIRRLPLRRIKSPEEHRQAQSLVLTLSRGRLDKGSSDYLDVLVDLISEYEVRSSQVVATNHVTAAELVQHWLVENSMSVSALSRKLGIAQSNLSEMLSGKRDWSKSAMREISRTLHIPVERFFTNELGRRF